jgi:hypothetical protein
MFLDELLSNEGGDGGSFDGDSVFESLENSFRKA